jgi:hypothetical protein
MSRERPAPLRGTAGGPDILFSHQERKGGRRLVDRAMRRAAHLSLPRRAQPTLHKGFEDGESCSVGYARTSGGRTRGLHVVCRPPRRRRGAVPVFLHAARLWLGRPEDLGFDGAAHRRRGRRRSMVSVFVESLAAVEGGGAPSFTHRGVASRRRGRRRSMATFAEPSRRRHSSWTLPRNRVGQTTRRRSFVDASAESQRWAAAQGGAGKGPKIRIRIPSS